MTLTINDVAKAFVCGNDARRATSNTRHEKSESLYYSYTTVIAFILNAYPNTMFYVRSTYSKTTAKHKSAAIHQACSHNMNTICIFCEYDDIHGDLKLENIIKAHVNHVVNVAAHLKFSKSEDRNYMICANHQLNQMFDLDDEVTKRVKRNQTKELYAFENYVHEATRMEQIRQAQKNKKINNNN